MNHGRLEQRSLELKHKGNFDLAHAPTVNRAGGRLHLLVLPFLPAAAGCLDWLIRGGLRRGHVNGIVEADHEVPL